MSCRLMHLVPQWSTCAGLGSRQVQQRLGALNVSLRCAVAELCGCAHPLPGNCPLTQWLVALPAVLLQLLASGKLGPEHEELAQRVWRWREQLQRAMDGCHSTSEQR